MATTQLNPRILILLLSAIGLIVLPHFNHIPLPLFGLFAFLWLWRFIAIVRPQLLPGSVLVFFCTFFAVVLLILLHQGIWGRDAGTGLLVTALGLKLLEIRKDRDLYLATYLSFFVAATQFLYLQNIFMAAYIFIVCCLLLCTLIFINSQNPNLQNSLKTSAVIIVQALPIMIVLFIFFPRLQAPRFAFLNDIQSGLSGLSDSLEPGSLTNLALSDQLAFRVTFKGKIPPNNERYWRGPVLSHTDGKRWTHVDYASPRFQPKAPKFFGQAYEYTLLLEPQKHPWVYALDMPAGFTQPITQNADYHLVSSENPNQRAEYHLSSYSQYKTGPISAKEKRINLTLPAYPSQKIIAFVKQLGGFEQPAQKFIHNLYQHFKNEAFYYTLKPPLYPDNPIESFLFEARRGFCSHYATAFVYLMRVASLPARLVTGYQGGELNTVGHFLEIRQANAHAWSEVWLPELGWVRFDPTTAVAPERVEQDINLDQQQQTGEVNFSSPTVNQAFSWLHQANSMWSNADYSWQRWIINYNGRTQSSLLSVLGINDIKNWVTWMFSLITAMTVCLALWLFRKPKQPIDQALWLYQYFCRKLAKAGISINPGEGAIDFARRCATFKPDRAVQINQITRLYTRIRYGRISSKKDLLLLKKLVNALVL